ncbi:MAG: MipA/OmpV family protein [Woeseiaceae bacterium]
MTIIAAPSSASEPAPAASPWRLGVALGYGSRSNPLIQSDDIPVLVDLDIAWFGERWFFDNGDVGFTLVDKSLVTANLVGRVNSDRVFFGKTNSRFVQVSAVGEPLQVPVEVNPPDRAYAVELGLEVLTDGRWGQLTLSTFGDVSGTHNGFEVAAEYSYLWHGARWSLEPTLALRHKSASLNDYYWGVRAEEANAALPAYHAGSGLNWVAGARASYYLTRHVRLAATVNYERLSPAIADSPLVTEQTVLGYFAGFAYQF